MLTEHNWNLHFSHGKEHNLRPYYSDGRTAMRGHRDTGHFGSGTYFSTYSFDSNASRYLLQNGGNNPNFIKIGDGVYRVDMDIYKNLYRVSSRRQGDVLYTMMYHLNELYNSVAFGEDEGDNAAHYQIIKADADALGLSCPSYMGLLRMAQSHQGNQSFSTLFMERNGYNGVNVSGVDFYDNTLYGSVIYDLSKTDGVITQVNPKTLFVPYERGNKEAIAYNGQDKKINALLGDSDSLDGIGSMPLADAMRLLKNYTYSERMLSPYKIAALPMEIQRRYFKMLYAYSKKSRRITEMLQHAFSGEYYKKYLKLIVSTNAFYFLNLVMEGASILVMLLRVYKNRLMWKDLDDETLLSSKKSYLRFLMSKMNRSLTTYETDYISNDYLK